MITADKYRFIEGTTKSSITTGNNDGTLDLANGTTGQVIERVTVTVPGATGDVAIVFYDDTPATTAITGTLYLAAQPPEGFHILKTVSSGTLGYRISGVTNTGKTAYLNVTYGN